MSRPSIIGLCVLAAVSMAAITCATAGNQAGEPHESKVVFVAASNAEPYSQALDGFRSVFPNVIVIVLDPKDPLHTRTLPAALAPPLSLVVAAGSDAIEAVALSKADVPMIATMVLHADRKSNSFWPLLVVHLDVAPSQIAAGIAELFPSRHRITAIWHANQVPVSEALAARITSLYQRAGIQMVLCKSPEDLLPAFLSLRGKADFVMTKPDASLYNTATVKPLILASLEHRLPIVGFSASFVRSGAAVGIYPDFRDIGLQTAALAQKFLAGQVRDSSEGPRTYVVAVNQRVLRLLGLDYRHRPGLVVYR
jgi:putative ABC transport system substrate-binding protein